METQRPAKAGLGQAPHGERESTPKRLRGLQKIQASANKRLRAQKARCEGWDSLICLNCHARRQSGMLSLIGQPDVLEVACHEAIWHALGQSGVLGQA